MSKYGDYRDPKSVEKLVHFLAHKIGRRAAALGCPHLTHDDLVQEIWEVWIKAVSGFKPESGVQFSTYFTRSAYHQINRLITNDQRAGLFGTLALDKPIDHGEGDDTSLYDTIPSADPLAEDVVVRESTRRASMARLSKEAQTFITLISAEDPELQKEIRASYAKQDHARQMGINAPVFTRITSAKAFDLMGVSRASRTKILAEVRTMGDRACKT